MTVLWICLLVELIHLSISPSLRHSKSESQTLTLTAITKNGLQKIAAPPTPDLSKWKSDKKITDEEILQILELPLAKESKPKNKNKKKKPAKKAAATNGGDGEESSDEE